MTKTPRSKSSLVTIFLTVLIDLLGFGIVIPLLPIYSEAYGASEIELGLLFSCFSLMQFVFAPIWGRLSDRIGRKPVLVGGLFGTAGAYVLFALADSMTGLMLARLLAGFFGANISTAQAYIADVTEEKDRAKGMGLIGAAFGLGFTLGPLIGGELADVSEIAGIPMGPNGTGAPGFLAALFSLSAALFGLFMLREPKVPRDENSRTFNTTVLKRVMSNARVRKVLFLYFTSIVAFSAFESVFILFGLTKFPSAFLETGLPPGTEIGMKEALGAARSAGRYLFFIGLVSAFIQGGLIRRLVPRFGEIKLIVAGPILLGLSLAIIGIAPSWTIVIMGCVFMPFGIGFNNPSLQGLISRSSDADIQGATLGVNQSLASLARVVGPVLATLCFRQFGPESPFLFAATLLFIAAGVAYSFGKKYGASYALPASDET